MPFPSSMVKSSALPSVCKACSERSSIQSSRPWNSGEKGLQAIRKSNKLINESKHRSLKYEVNNNYYLITNLHFKSGNICLREQGNTWLMCWIWEKHRLNIWVTLKEAKLFRSLRTRRAYGVFSISSRGLSTTGQLQSPRLRGSEPISSMLLGGPAA